MFESFITILATVAVVYLLMATMFPDRFAPQPKQKDEHYGANQWGVYTGRSTEVDESLKTIKVPKPARKERVEAGSAMYSGGKGISFRR